MNISTSFKNILCIRADNMGDVIMTGPALRALKRTFRCRITLLTSRMGSGITPFMKEIDATWIADLPWVKTDSGFKPEDCLDLVERLRSGKFDMAVIFTVYSQSPLPAAMLCWLAGIPRRLAYCRENPYQLLTDWVPDQEPFTVILHQVERDLNLVKTIGARPRQDRLRLIFRAEARRRALQKIAHAGVDLTKPWLLLHPGVSEAKREYPVDRWIETARLLQSALSIQLLISGAFPERSLAETIRRSLDGNAFTIAGLLDLEEFIALISETSLVISVNTATAHIAAAMNTPVVVLYALTNPQHEPWKVRSKVLHYSPEAGLHSRNEIIRQVSDRLYRENVPYPTARQILEAVRALITENRHSHLLNRAYG